MITDKIENIDKYDNIPQEVKNFLRGLTCNTPEGHYEICDGCFANIDVYNTKPIENCKLEAHKKYIDIQMLLEGFEELDYISTDGLKISEEYDEQRDVMFFEIPNKKLDTIQLVPYKFAMLYPDEAHRPQMTSGKTSQKVKKVVVKILATI